MFWKKNKAKPNFLNNFYSSVLNRTYDTFDNDFKLTTTPSLSNGYKLEITKNIGKYLQGSSCISKLSKQYFLTYLQPTTLIQLGIEPQGAYQLKVMKKIKNLTTTYHSVISESKEIFTQFESIYTSQFYNMAFKLVKPVFEASNLIYIVNYWKSFGKLELGFEIVGLEKHLGIALSGRIESSKGILCANLQRFNLLKISFYRRITDYIDCGIEIQRNLKRETGALLGGIRYKSNKTEIKGCINNLYNMGLSWEEKISSKVKITASAEYNFIDFEYGLSLIYED